MIYRTPYQDYEGGVQSKWGVVWTFCNLLKWPSETLTASRNDPGISWTELSVSFMLWAGRFLPVRIQDQNTIIPLEYDNPKIQLQPVKHRSLRVLSETFRLIVKHIQTFSKMKIIPTYKKQGASSLTRLGFSRYHEAGVSRRPVLPNTQDTCLYMQNLSKLNPADTPQSTIPQ